MKCHGPDGKVDRTYWIRLNNADYDFVNIKVSKDPIKIYDSFKLKEREEEKASNKKKNKKNKLRQVSQVGDIILPQ